MNNTATSSSNNDRWSRFGSACRRAFHVYAAWLVSITWWRFFWLSLLLLIGMGIVHDIPPFSWTYSEVISPSALPRKISKKPPAVSYTHLRAHETDSYLVCRLLLEKQNNSLRARE